MLEAVPSEIVHVVLDVSFMDVAAGVEHVVEGIVVPGQSGSDHIHSGEVGAWIGHREMLGWGIRCGVLIHHTPIISKLACFVTVSGPLTVSLRPGMCLRLTEALGTLLDKRRSQDSDIVYEL